MIPRRALLAAATLLAARPAHARAAPDEEMPREPWFIDSFLDLRDDNATATAAGKRLAIAWELRGCPPCIALHRLTLSNPMVCAFIQTHFDVVALDFAGARQVTFPDGTTAAEKPMARRQNIAGPPTFQIFDPTGREAARIEGFLDPVAFLALFRAATAPA